MRKCENCQFGNKCRSKCVCGHYAPLDEDDDTGRADTVRRNEFYAEWSKYVEYILNDDERYLDGETIRATKICF